MRYLRSSEVTPEMANWAWSVGKRYNWELGKTEARSFGFPVVARIEIHHDATASNPVPHDHPGVSLLEDTEPVEHPPVSIDVVEGIDVSDYQTYLAWDKIAESGRRFCYVKASEGGDMRARLYGQHMKNASDSGMFVGAYHFFLARHGAEQVKNFLAAVDACSTLPNLPYVLDVEVDDHQHPSQVIDNVSACVEAMNAAGHRPVIYTMPGFWNGLPRVELKADLWVAHWGVKAPAKVNGWDEWLFWQYASNALVPGYAHADVNRFRGTIETLRLL